MMKLASWNVNGLRACVNKGFIEWVAQEQPDILCLQETKAQEEQLAQEIKEINGYKSYFFSAEKKGYSGVALYIKENICPKNILKGIGIEEFDNEGRTIIVELEKFVLINSYYPNGQRDHNRVPYKMNFSRKMYEIANDYRKKKKHVVLTGDFNTAHHPIDLKNPKTNTKTTGFLLEERAFLDELEKGGYVDIYRKRNPELEGQYTWWTYRGDCRARNVGWRIDYFWINKSLEKYVKDAKLLPQVMGSDHCPLTLELDF